MALHINYDSTIAYFPAPADMMQVMVSLLTFRFPVAGWSAVLNKPYIAKIGFVASQYTCLLELFAQLSLSINRFTAITVPLKHNHNTLNFD
ncbi:hypothetical protein ANCCEY_08365 [Ancylostoma ceylanicum]|uniref:Uncharacterized protein n=1 Tax=Ancylostoma ceylanicum TaxID=53326 RepID=A0A0D6LKH1_9BILA|nr:hypothetical protein ANCCEY_08365 [Ancylostoma ceylanicum]